MNNRNLEMDLNLSQSFLIELGQFYDGLARKGDYSLLLFCRELKDLGSFLCWQRSIHQFRFAILYVGLDGGARKGRFDWCYFVSGS